MKPKVAFYWCASCGGCEEAVVDLDEQILDVVAAVDIVFWPVAMDFKEKDVEEMPDGSIDISFVNGAVRTTEQRRMALLMRRKSKMVIGFGSCAHMGGIPALGNLTDREGILTEVYGQTAPQLEYRDNGHTVTLPKLFDTVYALGRAIPVDYYVPGCPPSKKIILDAITALLSGAELPPKGTVLAPDHSMCDECPRHESHPEELSVERFRRVQEAVIDTATCLLAQGLPCLGPATRGGCGSRCIKGNMPCTGCFGPTSHVRDFGGKALSLVASVAAGTEPEQIDRALDGITDPAGTFYRYSLASAFLERKRMR